MIWPLAVAIEPTHLRLPVPGSLALDAGQKSLLPPEKLRAHGHFLSPAKQSADLSTTSPDLGPS